MTSTNAEPGTGLQKRTNWWGCFVIGLAGPILVTGIDPPAVQALGAAAVPLIAIATVMGMLLCLFAAELATVMPHRTGGIPSYTTEAFDPVHRGTATHLGGLSAWAYWLGWFPVAPINMILASAYITQLFGIPAGTLVPAVRVGRQPGRAVRPDHLGHRDPRHVCPLLPRYQVRGRGRHRDGHLVDGTADRADPASGGPAQFDALQ